MGSDMTVTRDGGFWALSDSYHLKFLIHHIYIKQERHFVLGEAARRDGSVRADFYPLTLNYSSNKIQDSRRKVVLRLAAGATCTRNLPPAPSTRSPSGRTGYRSAPSGSGQPSYSHWLGFPSSPPYIVHFRQDTRYRPFQRRTSP